MVLPSVNCILDSIKYGNLLLNLHMQIGYLLTLNLRQEPKDIPEIFYTVFL